MADACIQCGTVEPLILLYRPRPLMRSSEYAICVPCARHVRKEQDERAQQAIRVAERSGV